MGWRRPTGGLNCRCGFRFKDAIIREPSVQNSTVDHATPLALVPAEQTQNKHQQQHNTQQHDDRCEHGIAHNSTQVQQRGPPSNADATATRGERLSSRHPSTTPSPTPAACLGTQCTCTTSSRPTRTNNNNSNTQQQHCRHTVNDATTTTTTTTTTTSAHTTSSAIPTTTTTKLVPFLAAAAADCLRHNTLLAVIVAVAIMIAILKLASWQAVAGGHRADPDASVIAAQPRRQQYYQAPVSAATHEREDHDRTNNVTALASPLWHTICGLCTASRTMIAVLITIAGIIGALYLVYLAVRAILDMLIPPVDHNRHPEVRLDSMETPHIRHWEDLHSRAQLDCSHSNQYEASHSEYHLSRREHRRFRARVACGNIWRAAPTAGMALAHISDCQCSSNGVRSCRP